MVFSKYEQRQIRLIKEAVGEAKVTFLDATIALMLSQASEPSKDTDYVKWEKWKRKNEACRERLSKETQRLNRAVIKEMVFLDVCMEDKHLEEMPRRR